METKDYLQDIRDIKNMMSQSTQFISLSGLSGIMAGIYACVGGYMASRILPVSHSETEAAYVDYQEPNLQYIINSLLLIAFSIILLSIVTGIILSASKAKKSGEKLWNPSSRRLLINFSIPLVAGGTFGLLLLDKGYYGILAPIMLLFYGMACVNASKFTFRDVRYLGITLIVLGLLSTYFIGYGLLFWILGFGVCHIIYGSVMFFKYDRK